MGVGMFGFYVNLEDFDWCGWWGDEFFFYVLVFVLMYILCLLIEFDNGISFYFFLVFLEEVL